MSKDVSRSGIIGFLSTTATAIVSSFFASVFDRPANLIEEGIDVAIRSGDLSDSSLIARKIAETSVVLVATPEYLEKHGTPKHPNQLRQHRSVAYMHQGAPRPWVFGGKKIYPDCSPS